MNDLSRDISLLVSIARLDAALYNHRLELEHLPGRIAAAERQLSGFDAEKEKSINSFDEMKKEHRSLEQGLEDDETRIVKFKNDLMGVSTNKEYTAVLKEIELKEEEIGKKEERILELMDSLEETGEKHEDMLRELASKRGVVEAEKKKFEERVAFLEEDSKKLGAEKPTFLSELDPLVQRRYQRLIEKYGDVAATRVLGETCGGCGTQLPPQIAVEAKKNNQLISCQNCGRILIHYAD